MKKILIILSMMSVAYTDENPNLIQQEYIDEMYDSWNMANGSSISEIEKHLITLNELKNTIPSNEPNLILKAQKGIEALQEIKTTKTDTKIADLGECLHLCVKYYDQLIANNTSEHPFVIYFKNYANKYQAEDSEYLLCKIMITSILNEYELRFADAESNTSSIPDRIHKCMIYSLTWCDSEYFIERENGLEPMYDMYIYIFAKIKNDAFAHLDTLSQKQRINVIKELKYALDYAYQEPKTGNLVKRTAEYHNHFTRAASTALNEAITKYGIGLKDLQK